MSFFGKVDDRGMVIADTVVCILSGRAIVPGDLMVRIPQTPFFYRVSADARDLHTPERQAALLTLLHEQEATPTPEDKPITRTRRGAETASEEKDS